MTALTKERDTIRRDGQRAGLPMAAVKVFSGSMVCIDSATGYATKGATSTTLRALGMAEQTVDNSAGAAGDLTLPYWRGGWCRFANSGSTDLITTAEIGADCYIVDDQTVAKTSGSASRSIAGKVRDVDAGGVWISFP